MGENDGDRLSILHLTAPARVGGLETVVKLLTAGQTARAHDVAVVAVLDSRPDEHPFVGALREQGVSVEVLVLAGRAYRKEAARYRALLDSGQVHVVHTHGYRCDVLGGWVARRLGLPTVSTVHGFTRGDWKNRLYERVQRRQLRRFDAVVAVSRPLAEELSAVGVPAARIRVVPNAWRDSQRMDRRRAREVLGVPAEGPVIGWVGRLTREKGVDVLIDAVALMKDSSVHVSVVGDGPDARWLERRLEAPSLGERVRWQSVLPDAARFFEAFDCFVLSSRSEGTPMVLFEAMAAGVPIVATSVGGVPDVVGETEAFLVNAEDPGALAAAIDRALVDREAAAARTSRARQKLESDYGLDLWLDRYDEIYRSVLAAASGRGMAAS